MKKIVTVAAILSLINFASIQTAFAHGGGFFSDNNYGPAYGNNHFNGSSSSMKANRTFFDRGTRSARSGNRFAYDHGPEMIRGYGPGYGRHMMGDGPGMKRGYGWGPGGHMMGW